jgi:hypothetical protein
MRSESLDWNPLTYQAMRGLRRQCRILAIRADGKGYYGLVNEVTPEYVELANGSQKQLLKFFDSPTQFAIVKGPEPHKRKLADSQLFGKDKPADGR